MSGVENSAENATKDIIISNIKNIGDQSHPNYQTMKQLLN